MVIKRLWWHENPLLLQIGFVSDPQLITYKFCVSLCDVCSADTSVGERHYPTWALNSELIELSTSQKYLHQEWPNFMNSLFVCVRFVFALSCQSCCCLLRVLEMTVLTIPELLSYSSLSLSVLSPWSLLVTKSNCNHQLLLRHAESSNLYVE